MTPSEHLKTLKDYHLEFIATHTRLKPAHPDVAEDLKCIIATLTMAIVRLEHEISQNKE